MLSAQISESEGPRPFETGKRFNVGVGNTAPGDGSVRAGPDDQARHAPIDNRSGQSSVMGQLLAEGSRHFLDRTIEQDKVIGRALGPTLRQVAGNGFDAFGGGGSGDGAIGFKGDDPQPDL